MVYTKLFTLGIVLLLLCPAVLAWDVVFNDTFDRADSNIVGNSWVETETSASAEARIGSNRLILDSADDINEPIVEHSINIAKDVIEWSFYFNVQRTGAESMFEVFMQLGDSSTMVSPNTNDSTGVGINLKWASITDGGMDTIGGFGYVQGTSITEVDAFLDGNRQIKVIAYLDNYTFDLFINETAYATGVHFDNDVSLDTIRIYFDGVNQNNFAIREFDNISIVEKYIDIPYFDVNATIEPYVLLNQGTTKRIWCNGTANDPNGFTDLVSATGVIYSSSTTAEAAQNNNNNYKDTDCATATFTLDGSFACAFDVYFFAENDTWTCSVTISDEKGHLNSSNASFIIEELLAIRTDSTSLDLGSFRYPQDSGTTDYTQTIYNEGNVPFDLLIDTYNETPGSASSFTCSVGFIPVENLRVSQIANQDVSTKASAPAASALAIDFNLAKQSGSTAILPTQKEVYWGFIPPQAVFGSCQGTIQYAAVLS